MLRVTIVSFALVVATPISAGDPDATAKIIRAGIYEMEGSPQGPWKVKGVRETSTIRAEKGLRFGIEFEICGLDVASAAITATMSHPEITKPDGIKLVTQLAEMGPFPVSGGCFKSGYGFTFDHTYELVAGKWVIKIKYQDKELVEKAFDVSNGV